MSELRDPVRTCVICRNKFSKSSLVRYVRTSEGVLIEDEKKIRPGRGWYCCANPACVARMPLFRPKLKRLS